MAAPTFPVFTKEWQEPTVVTLAQQSTATLQTATAIVAIKNAFKGAAVAPWTVVGSSDGVAFNMAGTDLWVDTTDIVPSAAGNRSWIVLRNAAGMQLCLEFNQATNVGLTWKCSNAAGFTGGSLTARPTATDEFGFGATTNWFCGANVGRFRLLVLHSVDGAVTYAFIMRQGIILSVWMLGEANPTHGSWSPARIGYIQGSGGLTSSTINTATHFSDNDVMAGYAASGAMFLRATDAYSAGTMHTKQQYREAPTGKWQHWGVGLVCVNSPRRGKHGLIHDFFRVPNGIPAGWIMHSDDGEHATMVIGIGLAIPWSTGLSAQVL